MRIVDLSHYIEVNMNVFPGDPLPEVVPIAEIIKDGYRTKLISFCSHTGTHIDAPAHMIADGATLDELPCEMFFGTGIIADVSARVGQIIEFTDLGISEDVIRTADFLILYTGYGEKWQSEEYLKGFPTFSCECAHQLTGMELKGVGVDAISVDPVTSTNCPIHKVLLSAGLVIFENLCNLHCLPIGKPFRIVALPLLIKEADGAPARIIAIV